MEFGRCWHVPGNPKAVISWIEAHRPAGGSSHSHGYSIGPNGTASWEAGTFFTPAQPSVIALERLEVWTVAAAGGGTRLGATAKVAWIPTRPASERIPPGVSVISVSAEAEAPVPVSVSRTISEPANVRELVALIESLHRPSGVKTYCAAERLRGLTLELQFLSTTEAEPLAKVIARPGGCGDIRVSVHGQEQPDLSGSLDVIRLTEKLLGTQIYY